MRQVRLALVAGIGVLALCGVALMSGLVDYVSHPEVANAHVPPVGGTAVPDPTAHAPTPAPPAPIITAPVETPQPSPAADTRGQARAQEPGPRRHRVPRRGGG